ncbi:collagen alpha-1(I) chain-like [Haliaeetus albicilla]|uniref:collagen alpha-1(I) chain-like n=1 Tax=Haliaeetus albicilla TaxID=8969 RepID=UPI0037E827E3
MSALKMWRFQPLSVKPDTSPAPRTASRQGADTQPPPPAPLGHGDGVTPQSAAGHPTQAGTGARDLPPAPRPPPIPGGWVGRRHPASAVPGSTPADLLSASPGRPNLFLPVAPGPRCTPQTPTGEGREQLLRRRPPPHAADAPAHCPAQGSPQPPTTAGTQAARAPSRLSREGLGSWCRSPRPSAKAAGAGRRDGDPHPAGGPLHPMAPSKPRGSSRGASCNLTSGRPRDVAAWATLAQPWHPSPQKEEEGVVVAVTQGMGTPGDSPQHGQTRPPWPPHRQHNRERAEYSPPRGKNLGRLSGPAETVHPTDLERGGRGERQISPGPTGAGGGGEKPSPSPALPPPQPARRCPGRGGSRPGEGGKGNRRGGGGGCNRRSRRGRCLPRAGRGRARGPAPGPQSGRGGVPARGRVSQAPSDRGSGRQGSAAAGADSPGGRGENDDIRQGGEKGAPATGSGQAAAAAREQPGPSPASPPGRGGGPAGWRCRLRPGAAGQARGAGTILAAGEEGGAGAAGRGAGPGAASGGPAPPPPPRGGGGGLCQGHVSLPAAAMARGLTGTGGRGGGGGARTTCGGGGGGGGGRPRRAQRREHVRGGGAHRPARGRGAAPRGTTGAEGPGRARPGGERSVDGAGRGRGPAAAAAAVVAAAAGRRPRGGGGDGGGGGAEGPGGARPGAAARGPPQRSAARPFPEPRRAQGRGRAPPRGRGARGRGLKPLWAPPAARDAGAAPLPPLSRGGAGRGGRSFRSPRRRGGAGNAPSRAKPRLPARHAHRSGPPPHAPCREHVARRRTRHPPGTGTLPGPGITPARTHRHRHPPGTSTH